jgi:aryl-alcohol dehydrogenase-like predicted oxidoreductase
VRAGKVRHIGCSNFSPAQIDAAQGIARQRSLPAFVTAQDQYSLLARGIERDLLPALERHRLALLPYFPLASGMLSGKYRLGQPLPAGTRLSNPRYSDRVLSDANLRVVERLEQFCAARRRTMLQLAFGWLLAKPLVASVIAGASTPEQVRQNAGATEWKLTPDEVAEIDRITK